MVRKHADAVSPEAVAGATGRTPQEWQTLLVAAGARDWTHTRIARWLVDEHGVDGWWAQSVTVAFEQQVQGRRPGQRADGTFTVTRTRTLPGSRLEALATVAAAVTAAHGKPHGESLAASQPNIRWRLADGTRLGAAAGVANRSGTPITLTWEKLPDEESAARARAACDALFAAAR